MNESNAISKAMNYLKGCFNKPRNPDRIPRTLSDIWQVWEQFPDLRLGQILVCAVGKEDLFNIEDAELVKRLKEWVEEMTV